MFQTANRFLAHLFDQEPGINQKNMLSGMIHQVFNLKSTLQEFGKFFNSNSYNDKPSTTFIEEIKEVNFAYQYIPQNASDNLKINFFTEKVQE